MLFILVPRRLIERCSAGVHDVRAPRTGDLFTLTSLSGRRLKTGTLAGRRSKGLREQHSLGSPGRSRPYNLSTRHAWTPPSECGDVGRWQDRACRIQALDSQSQPVITMHASPSAQATRLELNNMAQCTPACRRRVVCRNTSLVAGAVNLVPGSGPHGFQRHS